jgi:uncharacterized protein YkwD
MKTILSISILTLFLFPIRDSNLVDDVLAQTNKFRKSNALPALIMRDELNSIAQQHSENMAKHKVQFGHKGFEKRQAQIHKSITGSSQFAENVAYGPTSGEAVVNDWKNSPGHRRNLLGPYKYIGIGVAYDKRGTPYYTQIFSD